MKCKLDEMIEDMDMASKSFYLEAVKIGNTPFVEINSLMRIYMAIFHNSLESGSNQLIANEYQIKVLAEKFNCIFGPILQDERNRQIFFEAMGWDGIIQKANQRTG